MLRYKSIFAALALASIFLLGGSTVFAQDEPQPPDNEKPKPAARSFPGLNDSNEDVQDTSGEQNRLRPDTTPLTGVENATLGTPAIPHNYLIPGIQYSTQIRSAGYGQANSSSWEVDHYLGGAISLSQAWSRAQFMMNYSGGGYFSSQSAVGNSFYHNLQAAQTFQWERFQVQIVDQFTYLPDSQFGFGVGTDLGTAGVPGSLMPVIPGLGGNYVPNQSIYAANGPRYSNAGVIQATYQLSARTSISAAGSYGVLRFSQTGNVNSDTVIGNVAYNYAINRFDTIGLVYRFSTNHFQGEPQSFGSHDVNFAYSRKLTGKLALQLFAGPSFTTYRVPVNGTTSQISIDASANLSAQFENGSVGLGYLHALTAGGGLLTGSTMDQVTTVFSRRLGRVWTGNLNFGFAHNKPVAATLQTSALSFNSYFAGGGLSRPLSRNVDLAVAYTATINSFSQSGCVGAACLPSQTVQFITINLGWHPRPFVLP